MDCGGGIVGDVAVVFASGETSRIVFSDSLSKTTLRVFSGVLKMSLLVFVLLTGLLNLSGVFISLGEVRPAKRGDSGTLKRPLPSTILDFLGEGDHVTLFLGVFDTGLQSNPEESTKALTGVLRMPFSGLLMGLCLVGVSTTKAFLAGDLNGLPLRDMPEQPATGLSATEETHNLVEGGVWGIPVVRGVFGVVGVPWLTLVRLAGDFVGVLFGLSKTLESVNSRDLVDLVACDSSEVRLGDIAAPNRRRMGERTVLMLRSLILLSLSVSCDAESALSRFRERG